MSAPSPRGLPGFPHDEQGPVFREPWEAKAFAMVLRLHERGLFSWTEWAGTLAQEISAARTSGDADLGDTYYEHWLRALETLVARKGAASIDELTRYQRAWADAAERTPHGSPIELRSS
jgi:nitrile hydratase accessory protein